MILSLVEGLRLARHDDLSIPRRVALLVIHELIKAFARHGRCQSAAAMMMLMMMRALLAAVAMKLNGGCGAAAAAAAALAPKSEALSEHPSGAKHDSALAQVLISLLVLTAIIQTRGDDAERHAAVSVLVFKKDVRKRAHWVIAFFFFDRI